jgi:hypothetical protein
MHLNSMPFEAATGGPPWPGKRRRFSVFTCDELARTTFHIEILFHFEARDAMNGPVRPAIGRPANCSIEGERAIAVR